MIYSFMHSIQMCDNSLIGIVSTMLLLIIASAHTVSSQSAIFINARPSIVGEMSPAHRYPKPRCFHNASCLGVVQPVFGTGWPHQKTTMRGRSWSKPVLKTWRLPLQLFFIKKLRSFCEYKIIFTKWSVDSINANLQKLFVYIAFCLLFANNLYFAKNRNYIYSEVFLLRSQIVFITLV